VKVFAYFGIFTWDLFFLPALNYRILFFAFAKSNVYFILSVYKFDHKKDLSFRPGYKTATLCLHGACYSFLFSTMRVSISTHLMWLMEPKW